MKVIDLLNKIANGEEVPKKIKYLTTTYTLRSNGNYYGEDGESNYQNGLYYQMIGSSRLNDEIEIIEEDEPKTLNDIRESYGLPRIEDKKIEKIPNTYLDKEMYSKYWDIDTKILQEKINEIIDYLDKGE